MIKERERKEEKKKGGGGKGRVQSERSMGEMEIITQSQLQASVCKVQYTIPLGFGIF